MSDISELLAAPCFICGYDGAKYWQANSHDFECAFHTIAGQNKREDFIVFSGTTALQSRYKKVVTSKEALKRKFGECR